MVLIISPLSISYGKRKQIWEDEEQTDFFPSEKLSSIEQQQDLIGEQAGFCEENSSNPTFKLRPLQDAGHVLQAPGLCSELQRLCP